MAAEVCLCESCGQPGSLALFWSPHLVPSGWIQQGGQQRYTHAIALYVACGIRSGFPRFFDAVPAEQVARAG